MVEFERLSDAAEKLIKLLREGGVEALDETLTASRTTAGTYRYSYDRYVQYFKDRQSGELTEQDLFIGFALAYSWMATIKQLNPARSTVNSAVAALNKLRALQAVDLGVTNYNLASIEPANTEQMAMMIEPLRYFLGSVIGTSKMLHFLNPEVFPIWDAVIHRFTREPKTNAADSLRSYAYYTFVVHHLINHADFEATIHQPLLEAMAHAHKAISGQYRTPEPMSKVRAAEFIMFFGGKAEHVAP